VNLVYLVRHGENPANLTKEFSYRKVDYPLTPKGVVQAEQTAEYFRQIGVDAIYASPLRRAVQTADHLAGAAGRPVQLLEQFRELNVGELEDRPPTLENWAEHDRVIAAWRAGRPEVPFPGGENYLTLLARMRDGMHRALDGRDGQRVVIVGHGGIFTATVGALCPAVRLEEVTGLPLHNCSITIMEIERSGQELTGRLVTWGAIEHLSGYAAELVRGTPQPAEVTEP
jgi:broad specificity phosphatase PhoE